MYNTAAKRIENDLTERMLKLPEGFFRDYRKKLEELTLPQVNEAARRYFHDNPIVVLVLGDAKTLKDPVAKALKIPATQVETFSFKDGI
jgi:predicted Zn-dependent peptidase